jgi:arsenate reductase
VTNPELLPELADYVAARLAELDLAIPDERATQLGALAGYVAAKSTAGEPVRLTFICTHNSRRSQLAQIWASTAAHLFSVAGVETYSGGTAATACNPRTVAALRRAGFRIAVLGHGANPLYEVRSGHGIEPIRAFSKVYDESPNPRDGFVAVMTCSSADQACPVVAGADARFSIPYDDPKSGDGTEREAATYDASCREIAREMLFLAAQASTLI